MKPIRILVPTDFSTCAANALKSAVHIAKHLNAKITLFHVKEEMILQEGSRSHFNEPVLNDELKSRFKEFVEPVRDIRQLSYDQMARIGDVEEQIAELAEEIDAEVIIMGTKGSSGIYEVLMGSNTYAVVRSSKIPVLVIPSGSEINEIHHIALAGDYKPIQPEMLEPVKLFAGIDGADIHIVHVDDNGNLTEKEKEAAMKFNRYLKNHRHHYHLIIGDDVEESLNSYCINKNIDVIAMIPRKHKLFDRVFDGGETKSMVFHTNIPLLTIPE